MLRLSSGLGRGQWRYESKWRMSLNLRHTSSQASNELDPKNEAHPILLLGTKESQTVSSLQALERLINPNPLTTLSSIMTPPTTLTPSLPSELQLQFDSLHRLEGRVPEKSLTVEVPSSLTLEQRQVQLEEQMIADAVLGYTAALQNLLKLGKGSGLKFVQKTLISW